MCISFEASIAAFTIGQLFGILCYKLNTPWSKTIGLFICFYSLVQLLEALIYKNNNILWSKLLVANLALQGVVFYSLIKIFKFNLNSQVNLALIICIIIASICLLSINNINTKANICKNGITWTFKNNNIFKCGYHLCILLL